VLYIVAIVVAVVVVVVVVDQQSHLARHVLPIPESHLMEVYFTT
jgi:hypothetical protein